MCGPTGTFIHPYILYEWPHRYIHPYILQPFTLMKNKKKNTKP